MPYNIFNNSISSISDSWKTGTESVWLQFKEAQSLQSQRVLQVRSQMGQAPIYAASTLC